MIQDVFNILLAPLAELKVSILHNQQPVCINILPLKRKCSIEPVLLVQGGLT